MRWALPVERAVHTVACHDGASGGMLAVRLAALLKGGVGKLTELRTGVARWLEENGYHSLQQMRGSMDSSRRPDPKAFERGNYMRLLQTWRAEA